MKKDILGNEHEENYYWSCTGDSRTIFGAWRNPNTGEIYMVSSQQRWTGKGVIVYNSESDTTECTATWECNDVKYEHLARAALLKKRLKLDNMERITFKMHDQTDDEIRNWDEGVPELDGYVHYDSDKVAEGGGSYFHYPCEWPLGRAVKAKMHDITVLNNGETTVMGSLEPIIVEVI